MVRFTDLTFQLSDITRYYCLLSGCLSPARKQSLKKTRREVLSLLPEAKVGEPPFRRSQVVVP